MKKLLLLTLAIPLITLAQPERDPRTNALLDKMARYMKVEKGHKADWLDFEKKLNDEKYDLLKKTQNAMFDLHEKMFDEVKKSGFSYDLLNKSFDEAVKLHLQENRDWQNLFKRIENDHRQLHEKHTRDLAQLGITNQ